MPPLERTDHEAFCLAYVASDDKVSAYKKAFRRCKSDAAARVGAVRLLARDDVSARNRELRQKAARSALAKHEENAVAALECMAVVNAASLIAEAEEARQLAMRIKNPAAAVSAIQAKGKLAGVWVEKRENLNRSADRMSDDELAEYLVRDGSKAPAAPPDDPSKFN